MRLFPVMPTLATVLLIAGLSPASAQIPRGEFIESSSPLPGGGQVTSRSEPGRGIQTVITSPSGNTAINDPQSVLNGNSSGNRETALRQLQGSLKSNGAPLIANPGYVYPAGNRVAQSFVLFPPVRATAPQSQQIPYQIPTLGLSNTLTARRAQLPSPCGCNSQIVQRAPVVPGPTMQIQPPASQAPTLAIQDPVQSVAFTPDPALQAPLIAPSGVQANRWISPIVSGSGVYQPVVRLANVPPGTYVGQGIIGQPTAYVDGQPIRNLFRYVFP